MFRDFNVETQLHNFISRSKYPESEWVEIKERSKICDLRGTIISAYHTTMIMCRFALHLISFVYSRKCKLSCTLMTDLSV